MLARNGWRSQPSPRRGFTVVEAAHDFSHGPVVVVIDDSPHTFDLFLSAADEAMARSRDLIVLDLGSVSLSDRIADEMSETDSREDSAIRAVLANPHVKVVRVKPANVPLGSVLRYCERLAPSLLVLSALQLDVDTLDAALVHRIFSSGFDVLIMTGHL
ncbi:MAG: hypothetical protein ACRDU9_07220 [Acidimicrobiia bacterium]